MLLSDYGPLVIEACIILHNTSLTNEFNKTNGNVDYQPQPDISKSPTTREREAKKECQSKE